MDKNKEHELLLNSIINTYLDLEKSKVKQTKFFYYDRNNSLRIISLD